MVQKEKKICLNYLKYPEENLEMIFPLFALYYKIGNDIKVREYLNKINKFNSYFVKIFNGALKKSNKVENGYYSRGDSFEIFMYLERYDYLLITMPRLHEQLQKI